MLTNDPRFWSKVKTQDIERIFTMHRNGFFQRDIGKALGVSQASVNRVLTGKTYSAESERIQQVVD